MSVFVRDVISLPILNGKVTLIGGSGGLGNEVLRVSVMEVSDFYTYDFERGLFLLSTFSCFRNDKDHMLRAFRSLAEKRLSGILLKLNRFIEAIPLEMIEIADQYGVPLLVTKENVKFRDVIYEIISGVCNDQMNSAVLHELLFNRQTDEEYVRERLRLLGFRPAQKYAVAALSPLDGCSSAEAWRCLRNLSDLARSTLPACLLHPIGNGLIMIYPISERATGTPLAQVRSDISSFIERSGSKGYLRAGISRLLTESCLLGSAWAEAKQAVQYANLIGSDQSACLYDDFFELEMVSHILGTDEYRRLRDQVIAPVLEYDNRFRSELWNSIGACFSYRTLKDASEALCIHISTLRYRLEKIQTLTGFDFFDEGNRYVLRTAYNLSLLEGLERHNIV